MFTTIQSRIPFANRLRLTMLTSVTILTLLAAGVRADEPEIVTIPSQDSVHRFAVRVLSQQSNFQQNDLITQSQVKQLLKALGKKGWSVRGEDELLSRVLADNAFLVRQLRGAKGREFLQQIQGYPGGIDRLDRLSQLPQGQASVQDLIHKIPNGAEWIQAMSETSRGEILGERLSNIQGVGDFNAPTGRLYQLVQLVPEIQSRLEPANRQVSTQSPSPTNRSTR